MSSRDAPLPMASDAGRGPVRGKAKQGRGGSRVDLIYQHIAPGDTEGGDGRGAVTAGSRRGGGGISPRRDPARARRRRRIRPGRGEIGGEGGEIGGGRAGGRGGGGLGQSVEKREREGVFYVHSCQ